MRQWLLSNEGRNAFNKCLVIVVHGFGEEGEGTHFSKMWAYSRDKGGHSKWAHDVIETLCYDSEQVLVSSIWFNF